MGIALVFVLLSSGVDVENHGGTRMSHAELRIIANLLTSAQYVLIWVMHRRVGSHPSQPLGTTCYLSSCGSNTLAWIYNLWRYSSHQGLGYTLA